jgi:heat shock protein HslJ
MRSPGLIRRPLRSSRVLVAAIALGALALAACGDDNSSSSDKGAAPTAADLDGRTFISTAVEGETLLDGSHISLVFTADTVAAVAGCNTMTGGYTIKDGTFAAPALAQTLMACDEPAMAQDAWVATLLQSAEITLDGSTLTLAQGDTKLTLGDGDTVANDNALDGGSWALDSLTDGTTTQAAPDGAFLAVADGQLYIATGCNRGFGGVTVNADGTAEIGAIALTRMACESPVNEWEQALTAFLTGTVTYAVSGTDVTLTNGTTTLTMHEVPWNPSA